MVWQVGKGRPRERWPGKLTWMRVEAAQGAVGRVSKAGLVRDARGAPRALTSDSGWRLRGGDDNLKDSTTEAGGEATVEAIFSGDGEGGTS